MGREAGYTTILKLLQIMTEKRLVVRDETARTHVYAAAYTQDQTQAQRNQETAARDTRPGGGSRHQARRVTMIPYLQTAGWALIQGCST